MKRNLTFEQKVHWAVACNEIESEFALHCYYHSPEKRPDCPETSVKWSKRSDEITSAHGFGAMKGYKTIIRDWSGGMEKMYKKNFSETVQAYPEVEGMDYYSTSGQVMHTLASSIIEIAKDGLSAKASFYTPGMVWSNLSASRHKRGFWMWERYGQDWVYEEGEWRVLHNQVMLDFGETMDNGNTGKIRYQKLMETGYIENDLMSGGHTPPVTIPGPANMDLWPVQVIQEKVMWPEPYKTYSDTWHYIPEPGNGEARIKVFDR